MERENKRVVRCKNNDVHRRSERPGEGNILAIFDKTGMYLKCGDRLCRRWWRVSVSFGGVDVDFSKVGIRMKKMPKGYHFDLESAPVIIEEE